MSLASMMLYAVILSLVGWRKELVKGLLLLGGLARDQGQPGHVCPAKEELFQYRNMCLSTNMASLASMVQGNLIMAEKRTEWKLMTLRT